MGGGLLWAGGLLGLEEQVLCARGQGQASGLPEGESLAPFSGLAVCPECGAEASCGAQSDRAVAPYEKRWTCLGSSHKSPSAGALPGPLTWWEGTWQRPGVF